MNGVKEKIHKSIINLKDIVEGIHRFGGTEYKLGKREIGHIHGNHLVDIPFPMKYRNEFIRKGDAQPHHILPDSGWVSIFLNNENDVNIAIMLSKKSYKLAIEQSMKRKQTSIKKSNNSVK